MDVKDWLTLAVAAIALGVSAWNLVVARASALGTAEGQLSIAHREHVWRLHKEYGLSALQIENLLRGETYRPGQPIRVDNNAYDTGYKDAVGAVAWILAPDAPRWAWVEEQERRPDN